MKLTVSNWSRKLIREAISEFGHENKVRVALFSAEKVIDIFESKYLNDNRPRKAIEAVKPWLSEPTEENKKKCKDAADTAYTAAADADAATYAAAYADAATYAAAYAASATYAAAYAAAYDDADAATCAAADAAAADAAAKQEIINYIVSLKDQPAYIDGAVYSFSDTVGHHNGNYVYDLSLNRFKRTRDTDTWFSPDMIGERIKNHGLINEYKPSVEDELLYGEDDPVHKPKHYEIFRGIEAKDVMKLVAESELVNHLSPWEVHCFMTMLKYRLRAGEKDALQQDIDKANRYRDCLEK